MLASKAGFDGHCGEQVVDLKYLQETALRAIDCSEERMERCTELGARGREEPWRLFVV